MTVCYYHNDMDGICSAAIVNLKYNGKVTLIPIQYGGELSIIEDEMIIVDFSFPPKIMAYILERCNKLIWIDHHKSAKINNSVMWHCKNVLGYRDTKKSGALLTWDWFFPCEKPPLIVEHVNDYDLWFKLMKGTDELHEGLSLVAEDPRNILWLKLLVNDIDYMAYYNDLLEKGETLLAAKRKRVEFLVSNADLVDFEGFRTMIINSPTDISAIGEYIYKEKKIPIALIYNIKHGQVNMSLRSNIIDVGKIAEKYKGGGHKLASAFSVDLNFLVKLIQNKK